MDGENKSGNFLVESFSKLKPDAKKKVVFAMLTGIFLILVGLLWQGRSSENIETSKSIPEKTKTLSLDPLLLNKSIYAEGIKADEKQNRAVEELRKEMAAREERLYALVGKNNSKSSGAVDGTGDKGLDGTGLKGFPPPVQPAINRGANRQYQSPQGGRNSFSEPPTVISGIGYVSSPDSLAGIVKEGNDSGKKKEETIYLPPSFMQATLLSGMDAPTGEGAKGEPMPSLLRIKDLAVLPNRFKKDLKGCFVIANGIGKLSAERAYLRLVTLSCLRYDGNAIIDQSIKGFVTDVDGKIGLAGRVVSKMGTTIAASMVAGFFGGAGEAISQASQTTSLNPFGSTQVLDPKMIGQAGAGKGISQGAERLQDFYLELARDSMPVIEVGATKDVTIVVTEGVDLKIKCIGENECE